MGWDGGWRLPVFAKTGTIGGQLSIFSELLKITLSSKLQVVTCSSAIVLEFVGCYVKLVSDCWSRCEDVFLYVKVYSCVSIRE